MAVKKPLKVYEMTYHIIKPQHKESESNSTISFHILSLLRKSARQEVKIRPNQKQAVLSFGSLHAGSSMVGNYFHDLAFYYH